MLKSLKQGRPLVSTQALYSEFNVLVSGEPGFSNTGTEKSEIIVSGDTGDLINGNSGDDVIFAGSGSGDDRTWRLAA